MCSIAIAMTFCLILSLGKDIHWPKIFALQCMLAYSTWSVWQSWTGTIVFCRLSDINVLSNPLGSRVWHCDDSTESEMLAHCTCGNNFLLSRNFCQNIKFWAPKTHLQGIYGQNWTLSNHNFLCQKFAAIYQRTATSCPRTFITHDAAVKY